MTVKQLKKSFINKEFSNLYLFYGEEDFLISECLDIAKRNVLSGKFDEFNLFEFTNENDFDERLSSTVSIDDISQAVEVLPQIDERTLIIAKHCKVLNENNKKIQNLLNNISKDTVTIFVEKSKEKVSKALYEIFNKNGVIVEFKKQDKDDLIKWANFLFAKENKKIEDVALKWLVEACNKDMFRIYNEVKKLSCATDDEIIDKNLIKALVAVDSEYKIFDMSDKLLKFDALSVYDLLKDFKLAKEEPSVIISLFFIQLNSLLLLKELKEENYPKPSDLLPGNIKWLAWKLSALSSKMEKQKLINTMDLCTKYDYEIKNGLIDGYKALEIIISNWLKVS